LFLFFALWQVGSGRPPVVGVLGSVIRWL